MKSVNTRQARETGLVLVLVLLAIEYFKTGSLLALSSGGIILLTMLVPALLKPLAFIWFKIAFAVNLIFSRIVLTLLFFCMVFPVGMIRRLLGADSMQRRKWKRGDSAFIVRNHTFTPKDLEPPY